MMAKIINLFGHNQPSRTISDAQSQQKNKRDLEIGRFIVFEADNKKGSFKRFGLKDKIAAAGAIYKLYNRAKAQGASPAKIKLASAHMYRFMHPPLEEALNGEELKEIGKKLPSAKVHAFFSVVEAIANATPGMDAQWEKMEVLKTTSLWKAEPYSDQRIDTRFEFLLEIIKSTVDRVVKDTKLDFLFSRAQNLPGLWDFHRDQFFQSDMALLRPQPYQDYFEHWTEAPLLPSVPLIRIPQATVKTVAVVGSAMDPDADVSYVLDPRVGHFGDDRLGATSLKGEKVAVEVVVYREIRLAIGPTTSAQQIGPLIESRAYIEIMLSEEAAHPLLPTCDIGMAVREGGCLFGTPGTYRRIWLPRFSDDAVEVLDRLMYWSTLPDAHDEVEHWYLSWMPLDLDHLTHWIDRPSQTAQADLLDGTPKRAMGAPLFTSDRLAFFVERQLRDGTIKEALKSRIAIIQAAVDHWEAEWSAAAKASVAEQLGRLQSDILDDTGEAI